MGFATIRYGGKEPLEREKLSSEGEHSTEQAVGGDSLENDPLAPISSSQLSQATTLGSSVVDSSILQSRIVDNTDLVGEAPPVIARREVSIPTLETQERKTPLPNEFSAVAATLRAKLAADRDELTKESVKEGSQVSEPRESYNNARIVKNPQPLRTAPKAAEINREQIPSAKSEGTDPVNTTAAVQVLRKRDLISDETLVSGLGLLLIYLVSFAIQFVSPGVVQDKLTTLATFFSALLSTALIFYATRATLMLALRQIVSLTPNVELLDSTLLLLLGGYQCYGLVAEFGILVEQKVALSLASVIFLIALSRFVDRKVRAMLTFSRELDLAQSSKVARRLTTDGRTTAEVAWSDLAAGDYIKLKAGERAPIDGEVVAGVVQLLERRGASPGTRRVKGVGQRVYGGSDILHGEVTVKVSAAARDTVFNCATEPVRSALKAADPEVALSRFNVGYFLFLVFASACAVLFWKDHEAPLYQLVLVAASVLAVSLPMRLALLLKEIPLQMLRVLFFRGVSLADVRAFKALAGSHSVAVDIDGEFIEKGVSLLSFEMLDERVDERLLRSVVASALRDDSDELQRVIAHQMCEEGEGARIFQTTNTSALVGRGVAANVDGAELSIGNEEFLIERGVELQPSDVAKKGMQTLVWYVALGSEVVARITVGIGGAYQVQRAQQHSALPISLLSSIEQDRADSFAKIAGVEKIRTSAELRGSDYVQKLSVLKPVCWTGHLPPPEGVLQNAQAAAGLLGVELAVSHPAAIIAALKSKAAQHSILIGGDDVATVINLIKLSKYLELTSKSLLIGGALLSILMIGSAFFGLLTPALVLITSLAALGAAALICSGCLRSA